VTKAQEQGRSGFWYWAARGLGVL